MTDAHDFTLINLRNGFLSFTSKNLQLCTWNWFSALFLPQTTGYHSAKTKRLSNNFKLNQRCLLPTKSIRLLLNPGNEQQEHQRYWSTRVYGKRNDGFPQISLHLTLSIPATGRCQVHFSCSGKGRSSSRARTWLLQRCMEPEEVA